MSLMSLLLGLIPSRPTKAPPKFLPDGKLRIHLLRGTFDSKQAAWDYCFAAEGDAPEQITVDQPDALIDTGFVEVIYQDITERLVEFLAPHEADGIVLNMMGSNTLVIITEDAFAGLPYELVSNQTLTYMGPQVVDG